MTRSLPIPAFALLLFVACSSARQQSAPRADSIDPTTDPSIVGTIDEAVLEGTIEVEEAMRVSRQVGRVAGVVAAVFGGPESETVDETVDRYLRTRDAVTIAGAVIGATKGAVEGAQRGYELDVQFAELHKLEGLTVTRPYPDEIDAYLASVPGDALLADVAAVFAGREERAIEIEAAGDTALDIRESLIQLGVPGSSLSMQRNDELQGVVLRIRYKA